MASSLIIFPTRDVVHSNGLKFLMALVILPMNYFKFEGRTIDQAVSRWLSTALSRVRAQAM
jgi:hypothetical protein